MKPATSMAGLSGGPHQLGHDPDWQQLETTTLFQAGLWDQSVMQAQLVLVAYPRCGPDRVREALRELIGSRLPREVERRMLSAGRTHVATTRVQGMGVQALPTDAQLLAQLSGEIPETHDATSLGWYRQTDSCFPQLRASVLALSEHEGTFDFDATASLEPFEEPAPSTNVAMAGGGSGLAPGPASGAGGSSSPSHRAAQQARAHASAAGTSVYRVMLGAVACSAPETGTAHSVLTAGTAERAAGLAMGRLSGGDCPQGSLPAAVARLLASPGSALGPAAARLAEEVRLESAGVGGRQEGSGSGGSSGTGSSSSSSSMGGGGSPLLDGRDSD